MKCMAFLSTLFVLFCFVKSIEYHFGVIYLILATFTYTHTSDTASLQWQFCCVNTIFMAVFFSILELEETTKKIVMYEQTRSGN